jgi:hypothetical protein
MGSASGTFDCENVSNGGKQDTKQDTFAKEVPVPSDVAKARFRGALAVELRMQGCTYDELAEILGYTHRSAARKAVMRTIAERAHVAVDVYKVQRYMAAEELHQRSWPAALRGDARALARCLNAMGERMFVSGIG